MARSPGSTRWPTCWACATFKNRTTENPGMSDRLLVLVRHGQSDWNLKNLFTGWKDPDLTEQGIAEAKQAGRKLKAKGFTFDIAFTSVLLRAQHTLDLMLAELGQTGLPVKIGRKTGRPQAEGEGFYVRYPLHVRAAACAAHARSDAGRTGPDRTAG